MSITTPQLNLSTVNGTPVFTLASFTVELIRVFGAKYLKELNTWIFPAFHPYGLLVLNDLKIISEDITLSEDVKAHQDFLTSIPECIDKRLLHEDFEFKITPYSHQIDSLVFAYYNLRTALLLECGTGKSGVVINLIRLLKFLGKENHKTLLIGPKAIQHKLAREVDFHSGGELSSIVIEGTLKKKRQLLGQSADVYITTYDVTAGEKAFSVNEKVPEKELTFTEYLYNNLDYGVIVCDESHNLLSPGSGKTKAVKYLSNKAPRRLILSGTASLGNPMHLFGQLDFLGPFNVETVWKFRNKFLTFADEQKRFVTGYKNLDTLQRRLSRTSIVYKAADCLDLPKLNIIDIPYTVSPQQKIDYNDLVMSTAEELEAKIHITEVAAITTRLTKLTQILSGFIYQSNKDPQICNGCAYLPECVANSIKPYTSRCQIVPDSPAPTVISYAENPKLEVLDELLDDILIEPTSKVIIWAHYIQELNQLEKLVNSRGLNYVSTRGGISSKDLDNSNQRFNNDPACRVYIGQVASGIGVDLTAANYTIYYSLTYDLGHYQQSLYRNYRIGQTRPVTVYRLLGSGSVEEYIALSLSKKHEIATTLTSKIHCMMCKEQKRCLEANVQPFDKDCIYDSKASKVITRPRII